MRVRAITMGFYGGARRRPGDVFEVPDGTKGTWFKPADVAPQPAPKPAQMGDVKPAAAQKAVRKKAEGAAAAAAQVAEPSDFA